MTTRSTVAKDPPKIDWEYVNAVTEVERTYEVETKDGRHFFKMYKPSYAKLIGKTKGWKMRIASSLKRTH